MSKFDVDSMTQTSSQQEEMNVSPAACCSLDSLLRPTTIITKSLPVAASTVRNGNAPGRGGRGSARTGIVLRRLVATCERKKSPSVKENHEPFHLPASPAPRITSFGLARASRYAYALRKSTGSGFGLWL